MKNLVVSIVITTKNEEKNIGNCLTSIKLQDFPEKEVEIIVVDNNSTDNTKKIARKYTQNVFNKGPERSAQRNFGMIEKAKGEYVLYLDADMILGKNVLKKTSEAFLDEKLAALYVPEIVLGNSYWCRVRRFERSFYDGTAVDCVRIIRKEIFKKVSGFDLSMTGPEDWDLDKKIRNEGKVRVLDTYDFSGIDKKLGRHSYPSDKLAYLSGLTEKAVIFHNESSFDLKKYLQKKKYYSKSFKTYINKWGKNDKDIKKQFGFFYRYFGVFLEQGKFKRMFKYLLLVFGVYWLRFLVGFNYFLTKLR